MLEKHDCLTYCSTTTVDIVESLAGHNFYFLFTLMPAGLHLCRAKVYPPMRTVGPLALEPFVYYKDSR